MFLPIQQNNGNIWKYGGFHLHLPALYSKDAKQACKYKWNGGDRSLSSGSPFSNVKEKWCFNIEVKNDGQPNKYSKYNIGKA